MGKYDDIIGRTHPTSKVHPRMSLQARAAQFSPFAALTGFDEAVREVERTTEERIELDEYERAELDYRLHRLQMAGENRPVVEITYFVSDPLKSGGSYVTERGVIRNIDSYRRTIHLLRLSKSQEETVEIPIGDITRIESRLFNREDC